MLSSRADVTARALKRLSRKLARTTIFSVQKVICKLRAHEYARVAACRIYVYQIEGLYLVILLRRSMFSKASILECC